MGKQIYEWYVTQVGYNFVRNEKKGNGKNNLNKYYSNVYFE